MKTTKFEGFGIMAFVLLLSALACGRTAPKIQDQPFGAGVSQPTSTASNENTNPTSSSIISADIWSRRDVSPSDVINQIEIASPGGAGGGGEVCFFEAEGQSYSAARLLVTSASEVASTFKINETAHLCGFGFSSDQIISFVINMPNGTTRTFTAKNEYGFGASAYAEIDITPSPGDPLGVYEVVATSGPATAETSYEVIQANSPTIGDNGGFGDGREVNFLIKKGDAIAIPLAGFPPNSVVKFFLYKYSNSFSLPKDHPSCNMECTGRILQFMTSWDSKINERGELVERIDTNSNTITTEYLILIAGTNPPVCKFYYPFMSNKGFDWNSIKCDAALDITIQ